MSRVTYQEAETYISELPKFTKKNTLEHTQKFLSFLGNPQNGKKVIHVAGTNGKGSVCVYLDAMLRAQRKHTGLFTSPHLIRMNERIRMDGEPVSDETFTRLFLRTQQSVRRMEAEGLPHPSFFEFLFGMAMAGFEEAGVEYVILETGLGGRMDATTAVENPVACVITSISLDHMQYLGDTVAKIAGEKAGIIVPGVPVIYDGNDPDAAEVIRARAEELGSPAYEVKRSDTEVIRNTSAGIDFAFRNEYYKDMVFSIPFIAKYQVMNSALALKTIEVLQNVISVSVDQIHAGIAGTRWQGRMETVLPGVIVDGAHNEDGVEKFVETAEHFQKECPLTLLFSAVDDKDYTDMIHTICSRITFRHVVVTSVGGYRKVPAERFAKLFTEAGASSVEVVEDVEKAFGRALEVKGDDGMLFCVGSLYLVGEIKDVIRRNKK